MKHCIIVKFNQDISRKIEHSFIEQIQDLFDNFKEIEGVNDVKVFKSCVNDDDRAHIMIQIDMEKAALEECNGSDTWLLWKKEYDRFIEEKIIFDFEDDKPFKKKKA